MQQQGTVPDPFTYFRVLSACASLQALEEGRRIHSQIIQSGNCESDAFVGSSLVAMYVKCGSMEDAERVFSTMPTRNALSWSAMILGYMKSGHGHKALALYRQMLQEGVEPEPVTFVRVLNVLVDMYTKCGSIRDAQQVFDGMPVRNVVSWTAIILGHVKCGQGQKALALFQQMQQEGEGTQPDLVTFVAVVNACANVGSLDEGRHVHKQIVQFGFESHVFVGSSLIDMYVKCGSIEDAQEVFNKMPIRDVVTWSAMILGHVKCGQGQKALALYRQMQHKGVQPDNVTFMGVLNASCSHAGLLNEGLCYFDSMGFVYNISATLEHCSCMVDLLGRAGHLQDAEDFINQMSCEPDAAVWRTLLGACRIHDNVEMGEHVAKRVLELDPGNAADYVALLPNINTAAVKWDLNTHMHQQRIKAPGFKQSTQQRGRTRNKRKGPTTRPKNRNLQLGGQVRRNLQLFGHVSVPFYLF
ncbi:unnamed protein product [Sphagnum jensenii]